jgi:pimeloyl-[acyl-carrier protein] methyl ester esterase
MLIATRGGGPPLVLIHGWAMHAGLFGGLLDRLAEHRTLYLVDLPGHGRSRDDGSPLALAPCVAEIAAQTPSAPWLGWSLGGLFALHAAVAHPAHVEALVMLCSTPRFVRAADWPHGMDVDVFRTFGANLEGDFRGTIERFLALETLGCERATAELRTLRSEAFAFGEPAPAALADGLGLLESSDLRALLPGLQRPSLWVSARRDRLVDWRAVAAAAALTPNARTLRLDSGHAPFLTHADRLAAAVLGFLGEAVRDADDLDEARSNRPAHLEADA